MKRSQAFPSQYVSKDDVATPRRVTIKNLLMETIKSDGGDEDKPVLHFSDFEKAMVLNNTNWQTIEEVYGDESDNWGGKQIELYLDPGVMFGGKRVGGVRVRVPNGASAPASNNGAWSWSLAVQKCAEVGADADALKAYLKEIGLTSYNAQRDTNAVKKFIADRHAESNFAGQPAQFQEEDIPF